MKDKKIKHTCRDCKYYSQSFLRACMGKCRLKSHLFCKVVKEGDTKACKDFDKRGVTECQCIQ